MASWIDELTERERFELQAYLAPINRDFGCLGIGFGPTAPSKPIISFEDRWTHLKQKREQSKDVEALVEGLISALRKARAA